LSLFTIQVLVDLKLGFYLFLLSFALEYLKTIFSILIDLFLFSYTSTPILPVLIPFPLYFPSNLLKRFAFPANQVLCFLKFIFFCFALIFERLFFPCIVERFYSL